MLARAPKDSLDSTDQLTISRLEKLAQEYEAKAVIMERRESGRPVKGSG